MPATLAEVQADVERRLRRGEQFTNVEDLVNATPGLGEAERTALWLLAWSYVHPLAQRREALAFLRALREREQAARDEMQRRIPAVRRPGRMT